MAITSFPFDGQDTDENQFSLLFRELQDSGVADSHGGPGFRVATSSGMAVQVQPGLALLRGFAVNSTTVETRSFPTSNTGTIVHRLVLRLDPTNNVVSMEVISGSPGGAAPALNQSNLGIYEIPLAQVTVPTGAANLDSTMIVDDRDFLGTRVGTWSTATRPTAPRKGKLGLNTSVGYMEFWNGTAWAPVQQSPHRVGDVKMSVSGAAIEAGWLVMDGTQYPVASYPLLASALGSQFSINATTFAVPDLRFASPTQAIPEVRPVGSGGGTREKTISVANLPAHAHSINHNHGQIGGGGHAHGHRASTRDGNNRGVMKAGDGGSDTTYAGSGGVTSTDSTHTHTIPTYVGNSGNTGNGAPLDITPPWLAVNFLIRAI